jgi:hypothetical protein
MDPKDDDAFFRFVQWSRATVASLQDQVSRHEASAAEQDRIIESQRRVGIRGPAHHNVAVNLSCFVVQDLEESAVLLGASQHELQRLSCDVVDTERRATLAEAVKARLEDAALQERAQVRRLVISILRASTLNTEIGAAYRT